MHHLTQRSKLMTLINNLESRSRMIKSSLKNCLQLTITLLQVTDHILFKIWSVQQHGKENSVYILLQALFFFLTTSQIFVKNNLQSIFVATVFQRLLNEFNSVRKPCLSILYSFGLEISQKLSQFARFYLIHKLSLCNSGNMQ